MGYFSGYSFDCRHFPAIFSRHIFPPYFAYLLFLVPSFGHPAMDKPKENIVISRTAKPENRSSKYLLGNEKLFLHFLFCLAQIWRYFAAKMSKKIYILKRQSFSHHYVFRIVCPIIVIKQLFWKYKRLEDGVESSEIGRPNFLHTWSTLLLCPV